MIHITPPRQKYVSMALDVKNGFAYVLTLFSLISDGLGRVHTHYPVGISVPMCFKIDFGLIVLIPY